MTTKNQSAHPGKGVTHGLLAAGVVASLLSTGPVALAEGDAKPAKTNDNVCVFFRSLYDWRALDDRNLVIWAPGQKDAYLVTVGFPIFGLKNQESLGFVDRNHDGQLCGFGGDEIVTGTDSYPEKSTINGISRLDDAALAALSEQYKVTLGKHAAPKPVK